MRDISHNIHSYILCGRTTPRRKIAVVIAYRENHMGLIYFYGLLFVAGFFLALKMCLDAGQYSRQMKIFFLCFAGISCVILTAGISVPWLDGEGDTVEKFARFTT